LNPAADKELIMHRFIFSFITALVLGVAASALALDGAALVGKWQLVEPARDSEGKPCPFVGQQIEFTSDGKMISANMPAPFRYKVNPEKVDAAGAMARNPELKGMEILLATVGGAQGDWSKAPIAYGVELKKNLLTMKVSGYTPAQYKKQK
jgi:hypothetical protein